MHFSLDKGAFKIYIRVLSFETLLFNKKELMKKLLKIDRTAIANALNITPQYVSMILTNKRKSKKYKTQIEEMIKKELKAA